MKRDPVVLGENCILRGEEVGKTRPNANVLIVGTTGCGKTTSVLLPTIARMRYSNPVMSFAKETDADHYESYMRSLGYKVHVLNIATPEKSTISFDPLSSVKTVQDIESLACSIMTAVKKWDDEYWPRKATQLIAALIAAARTSLVKGDDASMTDVLNLFDRTVPTETRSSFSTELDSTMQMLANLDPSCYAVREYNAWHSLPVRTASCIRDSAAAALSTMFPESIRCGMRSKPRLDLVRFVKNKEAVILVTSATEYTQAFYANLFYRDMERRLLRYAAECAKGELPREVRFFPARTHPTVARAISPPVTRTQNF